MARIFRLVAPPKTSGVNPLVVNGRTYSANAGDVVDAEEMDAVTLRENRWVQLGMVGTTAQRPAPSDPDYLNWLQRGFVFIDTTLAVAIVWDSIGKTWRDFVTGAVV